MHIGKSLSSRKSGDTSSGMTARNYGSICGRLRDLGMDRCLVVARPHCSSDAPKAFCRQCPTIRCHQRLARIFYVDDPALAIRGTQEFRDDAVTSQCSFGVSWALKWLWPKHSEAQRSSGSVDDRVIVSIPEEKMPGIPRDCQRHPHRQRGLHQSC